MYNFERFSHIFKNNINKRSRTAKGVSDVSSTPGKQRLLLEGLELSDQVERNTERLIKMIWDDVQINRRVVLSVGVLRNMFEGWYDIINHRLQSPEAYSKERAKFIAEARKLKEATGRDYRINHRYRLAVPKYLVERGAPVFPIVELEFQMDHFYYDLANALAARINQTIDTPQLLAFADMQVDGIIHPWVDGCGRLATVSVMWLAVWYGYDDLPIFGDRDEHYMALKSGDEPAQVQYYRMCLSEKQV